MPVPREPLPSEYENVKQHILTAVNHLAPDGKVQSEFVRLVHDMENEGQPQREVVLALLRRLIDGLDYGNW